MLNLEAMGNGGHHRLFQATKGRASAELLAMWSAAAPKPSGSVVSSDIFATGWGGASRARCLTHELERRTFAFSNR